MKVPLFLAAAASLAAASAAVAAPGILVPARPAAPEAVSTPSAGDSVPARILGERVAPGSVRAEHAVTAAAAAGLSLDALARAEDVLLAEIERGGFPGAAIAIGRRDHVVVERGVGRVGWIAGDEYVDPDRTIYDLASLTKVVATTSAVMLLVEDGRLVLDAPVSRYLPGWTGGGKERVTIRHLLTHTSGLPAGADVWSDTPAGALARALAVPLKAVPGQRVEYSDVGFVVLWAAAESAAAEPLYRVLDRRVFGPLGMRLTSFKPGEGCVACVPTEVRRNGTVIRGRVHDPTAYQLGGITGNAGLFATVHDLARFAAMLANDGELDGVRVFDRATVHEFTRRQPGAGTRALGWDTPSRVAEAGAAGERISPHAFGHTGFTGTSMWIDPDRGSWAVILTNRTYQPKASNRIQAVRRSVHDWVALACDNGGGFAAASSAASAAVGGVH
ncbi:MAG TPA: serine hydrolase [Longimicrobiaceae bacterium]|nr:serine hydrolase [Longimicrobiaceae bacterium]